MENIIIVLNVTFSSKDIAGKGDHVTLNTHSLNYYIIYLNKRESCGKRVSNVVLASGILGHSACLIRTPEYSEQIHCPKGVRYRQVWNRLERTLMCFYHSLVRYEDMESGCQFCRYLF